MSFITDPEKIKNLSQATIEQSPHGIIWVNSESSIKRVNLRACELIGYTKEELQNLQILDFDVAFPWKNFSDFWNQLKKDERLFFESEIISKSGRQFPVEISVYYVECGGIGYGCSTFKDITERKEAEKKIKENQKLLDAILNNQFQVNALVDTQGKILLVNKRALNFLNLKKEDVIGKYFWETLWWSHSEKEQRKVKQAIEKCLKGEIIRFESINLDKNGDIKYLDNSFSPLFDHNGNVEYIIPEARDITEKTEILEQLEKTNLELIEVKNKLEAENIYLKEEIKSDHNFGDMIGNSSEFIKMLEQIKNVAPTDANVLILGETGTGKELVARAIHNLSNRKNHPLVKVNCASLPTNLIESELFGHEKGAFTGAVSQKKGRFELADHGTIFLDEIGEIPLELQSKLLRVLQEGEFERIGGVYTKKVDVRIIAATNRNLEKLVLEGKFREDLYYRLNVFPVTCPPLRNREEDIPILVKYFIDKFNSKANKNIDTIPQKIMNQLITYSWPGNIRELENIIERAVIISLGNKLELGDWFCRSGNIKNDDLYRSLDDVEKEHILKVLEKTNGKIRGEDGAAIILGLKPTTLEARMLKLGIKK